jgi:hypothetical protein
MKTVIFHPFHVEIKEGPYTHKGPENFLINPEIPKDVPSIYWKLLNGKIHSMNTREREERDMMIRHEMDKPISKQEVAEKIESLNHDNKDLIKIMDAFHDQLINQAKEIKKLKRFILISSILTTLFVLLIKKFL